MLELSVTDLQLDAPLAFIVMQPVHELDLLQVLVMKLLPLRREGLVPSRILLQVGHQLVPLRQQTLSLLTFHFQLKTSGEFYQIRLRHVSVRLGFHL